MKNPKWPPFNNLAAHLQLQGLRLFIREPTGNFRHFFPLAANRHTVYSTTLRYLLVAPACAECFLKKYCNMQLAVTRGWTGILLSNESNIEKKIWQSFTVQWQRYFSFVFLLPDSSRTSKPLESSTPGPASQIQLTLFCCVIMKIKPQIFICQKLKWKRSLSGLNFFYNPLELLYMACKKGMSWTFGINRKLMPSFTLKHIKTSS